VKITVIGSAGRTGRLVLGEGLRRGHAITAFTRRPDSLSRVEGLRAVVPGDGRNLEDVRRAVRGQEAVISIVSPEGRGPTTVASDAARVLVAAMREAGVRRVVSVSVYALQGRRPWILISLVRWILRKPYADFARMERLFKESGLDWTIVRPPRLTDGPTTGLVRSEAGREDFARGPYSISRSDLAAVQLDLAADSSHVGEVLLVSARKKRRDRGRTHT
jgi:putative NADH-flavin reductase